MKMTRAILTILSWAILGIAWAQKQSDDVPLGNTIDEPNSGLPMYTKLNGTVYNLNEISPKISLNRTQAFLNCSQGTMYITLTFQEPFYGVAYADFDRNSACMTKGRGDNTAKLELPLKGCGTIQDPARVFTNNIIVRFHPGLEMDGDEVITIVCRYPTAKTGPLPNPFIAPPVPPLIQPKTSPPMSGMHIVLIICSLLFLALLLLGLGCSYMCLKRRPVRIIQRHPFGSGTGSEITKLSASSLGNISMFEGFKIPRALLPQPTYGSEANLVIDQSDTLPSDYPSESHSEVEARASSSLYSETIAEVETTAMTSASRVMHSRHSMGPIEPKFESQMRIKRPPPSPLPSESDASIALERNLTTILEREETTRMVESPSPRMTTFSYVPELHQPPSTPISRQQTPPVYSRILRKQAERETFTETLSAPRPPTATIHRPRSLTSLNTEHTETRSLTEVMDSSHAKYRVASILAPTPPPPPPIAPSTVTHVTQEYREHIREGVEPLVEPVVASRRPEITTHEVDDVFLRTVTEKKTIEDIERHRRQITEYHARPQILPDPKWNVNRNYPSEGLPPAPPEWENFSDVSSASNLTITNEPAPRPEDEIDVNIEPTYTARAEIPRPPHRYPDEASSTSYYHLERVLEPQYANEFTEEERKKWREIITTESTLRTLLTEAIVKEDYELIRKDSRYVNLFPSAKWDAIIRILSPNAGSTSSSSHGRSGQRYKRGKSLEFDNRSRRSSLPTLYEYESDGGSIRTVGQEANRHISGVHISHGVGGRVRKLSSTTRGGSEADLRSMSEMTVRDFVRVDRDDLTSLSSYEGESLVRSLSQPSLARSGSEFTEHWGMPSRNLPHWAADEDPTTSAETTPRAVRRADHMEASATYDSTHQGNSTGTYGRSTRYSESQSIQIKKNQRGNWFHDDSEPEMQI